LLLLHLPGRREKRIHDANVKKAAADQHSGKTYLPIFFARRFARNVGATCWAHGGLGRTSERPVLRAGRNQGFHDPNFSRARSARHNGKLGRRTFFAHRVLPRLEANYFESATLFGARGRRNRLWRK
tara:strand:- start:33 stop:413 length:381 start_codon:yes stop_codon:yes gene_type:complete